MEDLNVVPEPEKKNSKKTGAIIATVATALLCGCPGLGSVCWGGLSAIISFIPGAAIDVGGSSDPNTAFFAGVGALCGGLIFVAIPIVVGVLTLRKPKAPKEEALVSNEAIPPTA
ncbi:MAG: hypothetical protein JXB85_02160 [Anaerolineales bacterium]|nr:hypothetical protein [Anaerolineales bacterium]